jgi:hypothetical protein
MGLSYWVTGGFLPALGCTLLIATVEDVLFLLYESACGRRPWWPLYSHSWIPSAYGGWATFLSHNWGGVPSAYYYQIIAGLALLIFGGK